jgi:hypothetical protein
MAWLILLFLVLFWFMGYGPVEALRVPLFSLGRVSIDLWDILIFLLIIWLIDLLPGPIRSIVVIALLLWLLSVLGIIAIAGLNNLIILAVIIGLFLYLISGH